MSIAASSNRDMDMSVREKESDRDDMSDMTEILNQQNDLNKYNKLLMTTEGEIDPSHLLITEGIY
jgi:hypothetical protein